MSEHYDLSKPTDALLPFDQDEEEFLPRKSRKMHWLPKILTGVLLLCAICVATWYFLSGRVQGLIGMSIDEKASTESLSSSSVLLGSNATLLFRENLLPSHKYVTAFTTAGFTNQVMEAVNLIYLATLAGRTPIIPPLLPSHFGKLDTVAPMNFGDVFDIPRLAAKLGSPVLEWHEVKSIVYSNNSGTAPKTEEIGCWSTGAGNKASGGRPAISLVPDMLNLDVSYTPVPSTFTLSHGAEQRDYVWSIWALASLSFPESRQRQLDWQRPHILPALSGSGKKMDPDDQLLCFDLLYYTGVMETAPAIDFFADYSPFWSLVGTHLHWRPSLLELANQYLRRHFRVTETSPIPPFISVHVRRTDFEGGCYTEKDREKCFAPVKAYERRVNEIKQGLLAQPNGVNVTKVLVTSDERDPKWWDQVAALGPEWGWIDHDSEQTVQKHNKWCASNCELYAPYHLHRFYSVGFPSSWTPCFSRWEPGSLVPNRALCHT
ncbi:hypothetical protein FRC12_012582 [Ceratobasidium sp. 428]|nr:hypothetical protein FRC12_012582 [Ceratobasidium sp. 428]